jgi:hypothetical protein
MRKLLDAERLLFLALLALHVVPLWLFPFFPSQDGPSHLENAIILRNYLHSDLLQDFYTAPTSTPTGSATWPWSG